MITTPAADAERPGAGVVAEAIDLVEQEGHDRHRAIDESSRPPSSGWEKILYEADDVSGAWIVAGPLVAQVPVNYPLPYEINGLPRT